MWKLEEGSWGDSKEVIHDRNRIYEEKIEGSNTLKKNHMIWMIAGLVLAVSMTAFTGCSTGKKPEAQTAQVTEKAAPASGFQEFSKALHQEITTNWPSMNKVWPGLDYDNMNLVLFNLGEDGEVQEAYLLNTKTMRKLDEKEYQSLTPPNPGGYAEIKFEGKKGLSMSVDQETMKDKKALDTTYRIATHEPVHFYYQGEAEFDPNSDRSQAFPVDKTPRIYRNMLYHNLVLAYEKEGQEQEYLGKAKYWLEKWKSSFPQEYKEIHSTDIIEAPARYIDNFGTFIGKATTKEALAQEGNKNISRGKVFISSDDESYELGYVAALILDQKNPDWKANYYRQKMSIDEILLKDVAQVSEPVNSDIEARITKEVNTYNEKVGTEIQDIVKAHQDKNIPYLKLDITESTSSMSSTGIIRYGKEQVAVNYVNSFKVDNKAVEVNKTNVYDIGDPNGNLLIMIPLTMPYELNKDVLTVKSDKLKIDGIKVQSTTEDGRTVLYAKVKE